MSEARVGAPALVDSHDERALAMRAFRPGTRPRAQGPSESHTSNCELQTANFLGPGAWGLGPARLSPALRRFRLPIAADVCVEHGAPVAVRPFARGLAGGRVLTSAGPFRSSGYWWALDRRGWDRDEWEVELPDGVYRLARDRATGRWEIEGLID